VSRELLAQGVAGFPWRAQEMTKFPTVAINTVVDFKQDSAANDDYQLSRAA